MANKSYLCNTCSGEGKILLQDNDVQDCPTCGGDGKREPTVEELAEKETKPQPLFLTILGDYIWKCSKRGVINYTMTRIYDIQSLKPVLITGRKIQIVPFVKEVNRYGGEDLHRRIIDNYLKSKL
jgi:RecJ-like exonuclease